MKKSWSHLSQCFLMPQSTQKKRLRRNVRTLWQRVLKVFALKLKILMNFHALLCRRATGDVCFRGEFLRPCSTFLLSASASPRLLIFICLTIYASVYCDLRRHYVYQQYLLLIQKQSCHISTNNLCVNFRVLGEEESRH